MVPRLQNVFQVNEGSSQSRIADCAYKDGYKGLSEKTFIQNFIQKNDKR